MQTTRSGIPTTYRHTAFRSRLEARWAAFFDLVGWHWTYEPFDTGNWIPDFLIAGEAPFLVEIGPCVTRVEYVEKAEKPLGYLGHPTLVLGAATTFRSEGASPAGLIVNETPGACYGAFWQTCPDGLAVFGDDCDRPCRHVTGKHVHVWDTSEIDVLWRRAGNDVQWEARRPRSVGEILRTLQ